VSYDVRTVLKVHPEREVQDLVFVGRDTAFIGVQVVVHSEQKYNDDVGHKGKHRALEANDRYDSENPDADTK
jgi:hypothetical protein